MLTGIKTEEKKLLLCFDIKNKGKFRVKELNESHISVFSKVIKSNLLDQKNWYLEWQITYFIEDRSEVTVEDLLISQEIEVNDKKIYPYELSGIFKKVIEIGLINLKEVNNLKNWVCKTEQSIADSFSVTSKNCDKFKTININEFDFECIKLELPLFIHRNNDGTWIEVLIQKQQYAYGTQPMVYFCIPKSNFKKLDNNWIWEINTTNSNVLIALFKAFASASINHRNDVCKILEFLEKIKSPRKER